MGATIDFGVCRLAVVPVKADADKKSEQVTQLLFGDHYSVLEESRNHQWLRICIHSDGFEGWIDRLQHHTISQEYFEQINLANFKITTDIASTILYKKNPLTIVMGSIVPISASELFKMEEQFAFNGESKSLGQRRDVDFLMTVAQRYMNAPHQPGGKSPFGIDAAGFVQMVYRLTGYSIPRDVSGQYGHGRKIDNYTDALPGDLAIFKGKDGKSAHVGIVLPDHRIIHCSGHVRIDHFMEDGILQADTKIFTFSPLGIRRVLLS